MDVKRWASVSARPPRSCGNTVAAADGHDGASNALGPTAGRRHADSGMAACNASVPPSPPSRVPAYPSLPARRPRGISDLECRGYLVASPKNGDGGMVVACALSSVVSENGVSRVSGLSREPILFRLSSWLSSLPVPLPSSSASLCHCSA